MPDEQVPPTWLARIAALPRRTRGVVVRLLRQPADTSERLTEVVERLHELQAEVAAGTDSGPVEVLRQEVADLRAMVEEHQALATEAWRRLGSTTAALLTQAATGDLAHLPAAGTSLVTIILPVRDRSEALHRAVTSVVAQTYPDWELLIVDDGSEPPAALALGALAEDPRIHVLRCARAGAAAARNQGLSQARGDVVTFLDSDNWWFPRRLEAVMRSLAPDTPWLIDQQLVLAAAPDAHHVRDTQLPLRQLEVANFIDLGAVAVRRSLLEELRQEAPVGSPDGPFDTRLARLSDWDLVQRLAARAEPLRIPHVGHVYDNQSSDRISSREPFGPAYHRIRSRTIGRPAEGLRILFSEWHFPQITETYIQADIEGLKALGAEVEVWSDEDVAVPYEPGVPWRRGTFEDHIAAFRPHLVLTHWLNIGCDHRAVSRRLGIPHAVRCHGFDYDEAAIEQLANDPGVVVHLFPHLLGRFADRPNVVVDPVAFDHHRITPTSAKDRRLVLRISAGLLTKDLETFFLTASRCPEHRFVLGVGHTYKVEERTEELVQQAIDLGATVEVLTDLSHEKAAALTMDAGIYLHTHGTAHVLGMPISPVEAMASGSVVLARDLPGVGYLTDGALLYRGATPDARADHAGALINDTLRWSDERWAQQARVALDVAWTRYPANVVSNDLLRTWRERFGLVV